MRQGLAGKWPEHDTSPWLYRIISADVSQAANQSLFETALQLRNQYAKPPFPAFSAPCAKSAGGMERILRSNKILRFFRSQPRNFRLVDERVPLGDFVDDELLHGSGVLVFCSTPSSWKRCLICGELTAASIPCSGARTMALGVFAATAMPFHELTS